MTSTFGKNRQKLIAGILFLFLLFVTESVMASCNTVDEVKEPHGMRHIKLADPTIVLDDGTYYLTGTSQNSDQPVKGFTVLKSQDLKTWTTGTDEPYRYILSPKLEPTFGTDGFWAPQWFKTDKDWKYLYTANEKVAIAEGKNVTGLFGQSEPKAIDPSAGNIDPFLFRDDDGRYYLYHVRFGGGNYIWVAEFDIKSGTINKSTLKKCFDITQPWEHMKNYGDYKVMEGPTVVKWDGVYYLFYSANHYKDPDYAVGYATAPSPTGPWTKYKGNPIIRRDIVGENGSGHGDLFRGKDGRWYYVYHVWGDGTKPDARETRIVPLVLKKGRNGIYDISVKKNSIIIPQQKY